MDATSVVIENVARDKVFLFAESDSSCSGGIGRTSIGNEVEISIRHDVVGDSYTDRMTLYDFDGNGTIDGYVYTHNNLGPREKESEKEDVEGDGEMIWEHEKGSIIYVTEESFQYLIEYMDGDINRKNERYKVVQMSDSSREYLGRRFEGWQLNRSTCKQICNDTKGWLEQNSGRCKLENNNLTKKTPKDLFEECSINVDILRWCEEENKGCDAVFPLEYIYTYGLAHFVGEPIHLWRDN